MGCSPEASKPQVRLTSACPSINKSSNTTAIGAPVSSVTLIVFDWLLTPRLSTAIAEIADSPSVKLISVTLKLPCASVTGLPTIKPLRRSCTCTPGSAEPTTVISALLTTTPSIGLVNSGAPAGTGCTFTLMATLDTCPPESVA